MPRPSNYSRFDHPNTKNCCNCNYKRYNYMQKQNSVT
jgi:hypothetical protein